LFSVRESRIVSSAGAEFLFKGLRGMKNNAAAIKSLEGIDICWVEEGQTISAASWETLTPTIRKPDSEIWVTMNPDQETDPVYRLVRNPPENAIVRKVNWNMNPWFMDTSLPQEREWMRRTDPDAYAHVWEGECRRYTDAQVLLGKYRIESFSPVPGIWNGPYFGADWGFSQDPTALVRLWVHDRVLYVEYEAYGIGVEIDHTPALFDLVPESRKHTIRADSARPETISYMKRQDFCIVPAEKWHGSVEDGVAHLRGYEAIVIHPRCTHAAEEARLWSFKVDRLSGDVLPTLDERHDHTWDAARYALEPIIKRREAAFTPITVDF
jgi:phage terminase large subunit